MTEELKARSNFYLGDCREVMATLKENSIDSIVTDPPYGLSFMGKGWDHGVPGVEFWREALRVAKPGAHMLAFGGTRTYHRLTVAIEDAGWEIRDCIMWVYGSGFPKSHDVSKAIDKAAGAEREVVGSYTVGGTAAKGKRKGRAAASADEGSAIGCTKELIITAPATEAVRQWHGWGTALKPAWEPVIVARKPLVGTVAENVLRHGTGAINIDGCRVETNEAITNHSRGAESAKSKGKYGDSRPQGTHQTPGQSLGRWPANVIHDGSEKVVALFPQTTSGKMKPTHTNAARSVYGQNAADGYTTMETYGDTGSAARFFYCAKASKADRGQDNRHPTVKPTDLMRYLCRLVTPSGGVVLDPFMGSGSTGKAAILEGFRFIGIDLEQEYVDVAKRRIDRVLMRSET